ncbi:MAG: RHS repeat-associated core domain-containing protein, partial [Coriobacteriia bacterium]
DGTRYTYLWGPDRQPLSVTRTRSGQPAETFAYHTDALGSVVAMTDEDGVAVATYEYDPYGRPLLTWTQDPIGERNPLRHRAYYADAETGMFYLPARYYDPATYRFLSPDPAPPSAGDPLSLNAFVYCLGDPVGASDPSGAVTDIEAEAWSHYYYGNPHKTDGYFGLSKDRTAAEHATGQLRKAWRHGLRSGRPRTIILFGGWCPGDPRPQNHHERAAHNLASTMGGDVLVLSGKTQGGWGFALGGRSGSVDRLIYFGHAGHDGGDIAMSTGEDGIRWLDIKELPTRHMLGFGSIELVTCNGGLPGGVAEQMAEHFGCHVMGNRNLMTIGEQGDYGVFFGRGSLGFNVGNTWGWEDYDAF